MNVEVRNLENFHAFHFLRKIFRLSYYLPAAGSGARHVWQKHCITDSRTSPISIFVDFCLSQRRKKYFTKKTPEYHNRSSASPYGQQ